MIKRKKVLKTQSLFEKISASISSKLSIIGNKRRHTTDVTERLGVTLVWNVNSIQSMIPDDQNKCKNAMM